MSVFEKNLGYRDPNEWDRETCSCIHVVDNEVDTLGWSKSEWPEKASQGAFFAGLLNLIFKSYRILEKKKKIQSQRNHWDTTVLKHQRQGERTKKTGFDKWKGKHHDRQGLVSAISTM